MNLPDYLLEEAPDPDWCQTHAGPRPCPHCRDEEADRQDDERRTS